MGKAKKSGIMRALIKAAPAPERRQRGRVDESAMFPAPLPTSEAPPDYAAWLTALKTRIHVPVARLVGTNEASTFTGFCGKHDNDIFAPLETSKFVSTPEQCFLLAYRAPAREVYTKRAAASMSDFRHSMDSGRSPREQLGHQMMSKLFDVGLEAGLDDVNHYKERLDQILISRSFGQFHCYVACLEEPPVIMCSGGFFPEEDFHGNCLQDVADLR